MKKYFSKMLALLLMMSISLLSFAEEIALRVLATTDIHTQYTSYNYYTDTVNEQVGLVRLATLIKKNKEEAKGNVLLFDNGDTIQGTPLGDYLQKTFTGKKEVYPMMEAMNKLGYDAAALGNHEFNYGLPFLNSVIKGAKFPWLSANLYDAKGKKNYTKPYVILNKKFVDNNGKTQNVKVGVIGFLPPAIMIWDGAKLEGKVSTKDIIESAEKFVPEMKKKGADIIIALAHSGMGTVEGDPKRENLAYQLTQIAGIDAVVAGHSHVPFPSASYKGMPGVDIDKGLVNGKPFVIPGSLGDALGIMNIILDKSSKGKWQIKEATTERQLVYDRNTRKAVEEDKEIAAIFAKAHEGALEYIRNAIGETLSPIYSFLALGQDDSSIQLVNAAQKWYAEKTVKGTQYEGLPILSAAAPFKAGGRMGPEYYTNIPKGTLAIKNMADLYVYPNTVYILKLKGSDVKEWLEMSAGQFNTIDPTKATEQMLVNDSFPTYNFDVIDGVTYEIDITKAPRYDREGKVLNNTERIVNLQYNGKAINLNQDFLIVTNNYRAGGGGSFPGINLSKTAIAAPDENRQVIVDYIQTLKTIDPKADGNWKFKTVDGNKARVVLLSSPNAKEFIGNSFEYLGEGPNGYAKYLLK